MLIRPAIHRLRVGIAVTVLLMAAACSPSLGQQTAEAPATELPAPPTPSPTEPPQPQVTATIAVEQLPFEEIVPPPAGLVYQNQEGVWQIEPDGQSRHLTDQPDAFPSPKLSHAYRWDFENTLHLIALPTGEEKTISPEGQLSGLFTWANEETLLLGVWLSPDEAEGPNNGHLASLDVHTGELNVLDSENLMSSVPAQSADGRTIAFSSDRPMLYTREEDAMPFPAEDYSGLAGVQGHLSPAWSPDGRFLAWIVHGGPFGEDPAATMGLAIYDLESGTATLRLAFDPARWGATPPAAVWSPDGRWLALRVFANGVEGSGIWLLSADGSREHHIPGATGKANYPLWSPDGRQLFYLDMDDEAENPFTQRLIFDLESQASHPVAMEDGLGLLWLDKTSGDEANMPDPLCKRVPRPALLLMDRGEYYITDQMSGDACQFAFPGELPGLIQQGGESIYYHEMDFTTQSAVVMRLAPDGTATALPFTEIGPPAQFLHYVVSPDGRQVAWSASRPGDDNQAVSDLWLAGTDGEGLVQLIGGLPAEENRFAIPIRFSVDGQTLYFALQPLGVGGSWVSFSGRYDSLHAVPTSGGQPAERFRCPEGNLLCLGDFKENGEDITVAYTDSANKTIYLLLGDDGETVNQFSFPLADFLGYPTFGPGGELAFYVATLAEHADGYPVPRPGTVYVLQPPDEGEPQPVKSDDSVATIIGWLDSERLVYNSIDPGGNWGTVVTSLSGDAWIWGPGPTEFITILR